MPEEATVGMRIADLPTPVPGSSTTACEGCGQDVWLSPGTCQAMADGICPEFVLCLRCAAEAE